MSKKVLVPVANGSEELESVAIIDTLRRAGADLTVASVEDQREVKCSRGVVLVADVILSEPWVLKQQWDLIVLPGGRGGAEKFSATPALIELLNHQRQSNRLYAAICASPALAFSPHHLLDGRKATCYPSFFSLLPDQEAAASRVVVDGNLVTSQGPGTAVDFALELSKLLFGEEKAKEVASQMLIQM